MHGDARRRDPHGIRSRGHHGRTGKRRARCRTRRARPLVSEAVITEAVTTAAEYGAAAPVVPVKDSIKRIKDGNIAADVARDTLAAVQTPQVFRKDLLRRALTSAAERGYSFTDDCAAVESLGTIVKATHGSYQNIKITTPEDILVAEALLTREDK